MPGIVVLGEVDDGQMQPVTAELLAAGRRLQETLGCDVGAALLGAKVCDAAAASAFSYGADVVYTVEDPLLGGAFRGRHLVAALHEVCRQVEPDVVLVGRSEVGRRRRAEAGLQAGRWSRPGLHRHRRRPRDDARRCDAPHLRRQRPGEGDVPRLRDPGRSRQAQGFEPLEPDPARDGEVVTIDAGLDASVVRSRLVETVRSESVGVRLEDAPWW